MTSTTAIQDKIRDYLTPRGASKHTLQCLTEHTLQCFVGMVQTGEASLSDFEAVGGDTLRTAVAESLGADMQNQLDLVAHLCDEFKDWCLDMVGDGMTRRFDDHFDFLNAAMETWSDMKSEDDD